MCACQNIIDESLSKEPFICCQSTDTTSRISFNLKDRKTPISNGVKYAIRKYSDYQICVVWNVERRRKYGGTLNFTLSKRYNEFDVELNQDTVYAHYCTFKDNHKNSVDDKVLILGMSHLDDFVENSDYWMAFNTEDDDCPSDIEEIERFFWPSEKKRKEYSAKHKQRDANFRRIVLDVYGNKCAICECNIPEVLQAAHERGYEAANTEWDDPKHGVCLCANHHLMYDRGLIDIDLLEKTVRLHTLKEPMLSWQKTFIKRCTGRLKYTI